MKLWQKLTLATNNSELIVIYMYSVNDAAGTTLTKYFKFILLIFWIMKFEYKNQQIIHYLDNFGLIHSVYVHAFKKMHCNALKKKTATCKWQFVCGVVV